MFSFTISQHPNDPDLLCIDRTCYDLTPPDYVMERNGGLAYIVSCDPPREPSRYFALVKGDDGEPDLIESPMASAIGEALYGPTEEDCEYSQVIGEAMTRLAAGCAHGLEEEEAKGVNVSDRGVGFPHSAVPAPGSAEFATFVVLIGENNDCGWNVGQVRRALQPLNV